MSGAAITDPYALRKLASICLPLSVTSCRTTSHCDHRRQKGETRFG